MSLKFSNPDITDRDDLPDGNICKTIGDNFTNIYTKDAFEEDGSLIYVGNVTNNNIKIEIEWVEGKRIVYTVNLSDVTLENE